MMLPHAKPTRYAIYTRQSVDKGDEFSSCEVQFLTCQDFANATGGPGLHWTGQRFDDQGYSGTTLDRPAMRKLRKVIDLGGIDRLYAVALDRLSRSMRDTIVLLDELDKAGVELQLVHQPEMIGGAQGRFLRHVLAAFAEFEREMIATRIAESRVYLKKHGRRLAGPPPFGYDADPVTKQLVPNKVEARRARAIFKRAAAGESPKQIAFACNKQGWTTKTHLSKRSGKTIGGGRWTARQVVAMLRNPVYIGRFAEGEESRPGSHQAIVDSAVFQAAQNALTSRRTTDRLGKGRQSQDFLFRKKILCPRCARLLTTYTITKKTGPRSGLVYRYYSCRSTAGGRARCKGVQYPASELEKTVGDMLLEPDVWRELLGNQASEENVAIAVDTWTMIPWLWRARFLDQYVQRVELRPKKSELSITFDPAFPKTFLAK